MFVFASLCKDQPEQLVLQLLRQISLGEFSDPTTQVQNLPGSVAISGSFEEVLVLFPVQHLV